MDLKFEKMNDAYRSKYYPQNSVFERWNADAKRGSMLSLIVMTLLGALFGAAIAWEISMILYHMRNGSSDLEVGLIALAITAVPFLLCMVGVVFSIKAYRKGTDAQIQKIAKISGLSEAHIREFGRQALDSDSYILKLKNGVAAALAGQKDGILTRDYLWMGDAQGMIVKREDIIGVCFYLWSYYAGKKKIWNQSVAVLTRQNQIASAEAGEEQGLAFMELLAQAHPSIHVEKKQIREGKELDDWRNELCGGACVPQE